MNIKQATRAYEAWLGDQIPLLPADLKVKHERMSENPFAFLRATFYRWSQVWPTVCPDLDRAPELFGIGDLHVENFGTWRDSEGRLVWGVNDFDEACRLPYANDLVRLGVSAWLATAGSRRQHDLEDLCDLILSGYKESLEKGGGPFVLAEHHHWLRTLAMSELRDPVRFWEKLERCPIVSASAPSRVRLILKRAFPKDTRDFRIAHRISGLGSLGRRRFTALAEWHGGLLAREAKELVGSAWDWQRSRPNSDILYEPVMRRAVRTADPAVSVQGVWLVRRLAPDCSRVELGSLDGSKGLTKMLQAMGWETGNIHLGTKASVRAVLRDLSTRRGRWLSKAVAAMAEATVADWRDWKKE